MVSGAESFKRRSLLIMTIQKAYYHGLKEEAANRLAAVVDGIFPEGLSAFAAEHGFALEDFVEVGDVFSSNRHLVVMAA
jgi:hypothetical protein